MTDKYKELLKKVKEEPLPEGFMQQLSKKLDVVDEKKKKSIVFFNFMKTGAVIAALFVGAVLLKGVYEESGIKSTKVTYDKMIIEEKTGGSKPAVQSAKKEENVPLLVDEVPAGKAVMTDDAKPAAESEAAPAPAAESVSKLKASYEFGVSSPEKAEAQQKAAVVMNKKAASRPAPAAYDAQIERQIYYGENCGMEKPGERVITSSAEMKALLNDMPEISARQAFLKDINFKYSTVVFIFAGQKPTSGYSVIVTDISETVNGVGVKYRISEPSKDALTAQVLTTPYAAVVIGSAGRQIIFIK